MKSSDLIPVSNPKVHALHSKKEIVDAVMRVIESGWYILGEEVTAFEREFAEFIGAAHCIGTGNGTDAIVLALKAAGINPGDEVITVSHSAVATVAAIELSGATPVFCDIDPLSRCIDPAAIENLISEKTRAIVPVHIYGQPCDMKSVMALADKYKLKVIEDCAQSHGAMIENKKTGSFGHASAFSFYPTKNLGALGDGGAVVTNDEELAQKASWLREYGWKERYVSHIPGFNTRLDELQAAILRIRLKSLELDNKMRRSIAFKYSQALLGSCIIAPAKIPSTVHVMHLYVVESKNRLHLRNYLAEKGIGTAVHYPLAIHQQPAYQGRIKGIQYLLNTEALYKGILSLPMYPELEDYQVEKICNSLREYGQ